jgi:hypothetical protein
MRALSMEVVMAKEKDLDDMSVEELDALHERIMRAKEAKALDYQNELIAQYQELREKMVKAGVANEDQLPRFKRRGWTRQTKH